ELGQVGIAGIEQSPDLIGSRQILVEIELAPVIGGIDVGEREIAYEGLAVLQQPAWPRLADHPLVPTALFLAQRREVGADLFGARHPAGKMRLAVAHDAALERLERPD